MTTRTRFAPSPTGFLHVGGIRTALFAFLVARQAGGQFILRLEDTDKAREVAGSREHLIASLKALHLDYDEGPDIGGPHGPYVQSQRLEHYRQWAQKLIDADRAYADPYTPEQIQAFRDAAQAEKRAFRYRDHRPDNPPAWDGTTPLRFKAEPKSYTYHDEVMGDVTTSPEVVDDFILIKSDGYPTYNFAHIIDDAEMNITHVIRGQEFISSMPNYLALYEALGLLRPVFAHLPHIMNEQGNKKLGKRDGAKDVLDYIRDGYLPEALDSFIATMGWNDGTEQETFTMSELTAKFSLSRVQRSGARFDEKRLLWTNGQFIRSLALDDLAERVNDFWPDSAAGADEGYRRRILVLAQDRLKTLRDLGGFGYFFAEPEINLELIDSNKQLKKLSESERRRLLETAHHELTTLTDWTPDTIQTRLNELLEITGQKPGILFSLIRIAITWAPFSPQLNDTLALIGRERTLARLGQGIDAFSADVSVP
jgi:glutamate--tRNA ligase